MAKVVHKYKLYNNGVLEGVYSEDELMVRFGIAASTLRFRVCNYKELADGYTAEIAPDKSLKKKGAITDPQMIELLKEWDEVRKLFLRNERIGN